MLSTQRIIKIIVWFNRRFSKNPAEDIYYFTEWLERFDSGAFLYHMDDESKQVWNELGVK